MPVTASVESDAQLLRLLQVGVVLEEVVEARAHRHYRALPPAERDDAVEALLEEAAAESATHRRRLEALVDELAADSVPFEAVESLVHEHYDGGDVDFDDVLYDQLSGEETAYKFYDDVLAALPDADPGLGVDLDRLRDTLREIRREEAEGVEEVVALMDEYGTSTDS